MLYKVFKQLNLPPEKASLCDEKGDIDRAKKPWEYLSTNHKIGTPEPLFKELVCPCVAYPLSMHVLIGGRYPHVHAFDVNGGVGIFGGAWSYFYHVFLIYFNIH